MRLRAGAVRLDGYWLAPYGLGYRVQPARMPAADARPLWAGYLGTSPEAPRDYGNDMVACDYILFRGMALLEKGLVIEALSAFQESERMGYGVKAHYNNIGSILAEKGLFGPALRQYEKALQIKGGYVLARANMGRVCLELGQIDEAIRNLEEASRLDPKNRSILADLEEARRRAGGKTPR